MRKNTFKRVLVTGASSGIGYDAAFALAVAGYEVFAGARRVSLMEPLRAVGVTPLALDVCSEQSIQACLSACGPVDVLVNCAGYGSLGPIETVPPEEWRQQMETNLFGLARLCQLVLPGMRTRGCGRIINIGSVAGRVPVHFCGWYNVSKYGVEAFSDALRMEMRPYGIDVSIIEPSGIRTQWGAIAASHLEAACTGTAYEAPGLRESGVFRKAYTLRLLSSTAVVTRAVLRAVRARRPRARYLVGLGSGTLVLLHTLLPTRWWDALARVLTKPWLSRCVKAL